MSNDTNNFVLAANTPDNTDFIDSLNSLSVEDIVPPHKKKRKKNSFSLFKISRLLVVFLCIGVFIYCISELSSIMNDYQRGDNLYGEIENGYQSIIEGWTLSNVSAMNISKSDIPMANYDDVKTNGITIYEPPANSIDRVTSSPKFRALLSYIENLRDTQNKDMYGYINIPNTQVHYPMVQTTDNDYYLKHAFDGGYLAVGSIFIDCRNEKKVEDNKNIVIYGHNMLNGSMFCDATKFLDESFFMNPANDIEITTFDGHYTFRVFSAYTTNKYDNYFKTYFPTNDSYLEFLTEREAKSHFHKEGVTFSPDDVIITLSTCILGDDDGRYAIHAKLIKVER
jgi:sortase B